jgi:aryl-alcohol dehydrogenase-like predicted oxidoreductase
MLPLCAAEGIGVIPWSPLARGRLTRPAGVATGRTGTDIFGKTLYDGSEEADRAIIDTVVRLASEKGVKPAQVALAWVLQKQPVTAPIVGVTKLEQLSDAVGALEVVLSADDVKALEAPYRARPNAGFN